MKTVYDLILEERERNNPKAKCSICGNEYDKTSMWKVYIISDNKTIYGCGKCSRPESK